MLQGFACNLHVVCATVVLVVCCTSCSTVCRQAAFVVVPAVYYVAPCGHTGSLGG